MTAPERIAHWLELPWLNRGRLVFYSAAICLLFLAFTALWTALALAHGLVDPVGIPFGHVFIEFWAAGKAALGRDPAAVYDFPAFLALQRTAVGGVRALYPWHYPPLLLLFLPPFALLPYLAAVPLWYGCNLAAYLALARRLAPAPQLLWTALAFPGALIAFHVGQFGFALVAAFGWALLLLDEVPLLAGLLIALLAVKPHLFLLVPLALLAARRWTAFAAAALGVLALSLASWLIFGSEVWLAFLADIRLFEKSHVLLSGAHAPPAEGENFLLWNWQPSVFVMAETLGLPQALAAALQAATAIAAAAAVIWAWRGHAPRTLRSAALVAAGLLVPPYLYNYDLVLLILPIAWLGWHGARHGWLPGEKLALLVAWLSPGLVTPLAGLLGVQLGPLLLAGVLWAICRRIAYERRVASPLLIAGWQWR